MNKKIAIAVAILIIVLAIGVGVWRWENEEKATQKTQNQVQDKGAKKELEIPKKTANEIITLKNCGFFDKKINLLKTENYNIFDGSVFESVVCGYIVIRETESYGRRQKDVYFRVVEFLDDKLEKSIIDSIKGGNSVNRIENGVVEFNLGCMDGNKIIGTNYDEKYVDEETEKLILKSDDKNLIAIKLKFGVSRNVGCSCCNLAKTIRVINNRM